MYRFFIFEINRWLRAPMVWIFLGVVTLLVFGAVASDNISIGGGSGNVFKNAPYVVQQWYGVMSLICLLMTTAFMNATAVRDFSTGMYQFVFTSPIRERDYFFGKFFGAYVISLIPLLGVSLGILIGSWMPWVAEERIGPVIWSGHFNGFFGLAVPNVFISGVVLYGLAVLFRSNLISFVGAMALLVVYGIAGGFLDDMDKEWLANLLDPFGFQPLSVDTKYMTVAEKNTTGATLSGAFLTNRLVWLGISGALLLFLYSRFSFAIGNAKQRKQAPSTPEEVSKPSKFNKQAAFEPNNKGGFSFLAFLKLVVFEWKAVVKNQAFLILVIIGMINLVVSLTSFAGSYGTSYYPVTYDVVDNIKNVFAIFIIAIITFYSGVLVWRDRDAGIHEIADATPAALGMRFVSKIIGLLGGLLVIFLAAIVVGIIAQAAHGYYHFELGVYLKILIGIEWPEYFFLISLAVLVQYLVFNRYLGYFVFVALVIVNMFIWNVLELNSNMLEFGSLPWYIYSDMNGLGPFVPGLVGFFIYWFLFCILLLMLAFAFVPRGTETAFSPRLKAAAKRIKSSRVLYLSALLLFLGYASFTYYNTFVLNSNLSPKEGEQRAVDYELTYKYLEGIHQPKWVALDYKIDVFPYQRGLNYTVTGKLVNKTSNPIQEIYFTVPSMPDTLGIAIQDATENIRDERLSFRSYKLAKPLQPGDTLPISISGAYRARGFENSVSFNQLTQNGTFFNNFDILPSIGYSESMEIRSKNRRKKLDLPPRKRLPELDDENTEARMVSYITEDADWVDVTTTITTAADQIAVAPGSLINQWEENGRAGFYYKLDHKALNFYSFISARYEVAREEWNGVAIEVYHIPQHQYNVPNMLRSIRASLAYYTEHFGPYYHKQCRIIEFPRYAGFAQAFPGTMPYSEGLGFITDLRKVTEEDIDLVFYVVAHEMAHQYWAHQVIGAKMRGSEMMSESFAQYSALMVMEREYGRDKMKKFLKYEMDRYLQGRSNEQQAERPLQETESQGYIHYNKGSVVMYYLKEMIGEEAVNDGLRELIQNYGYQDPPWPTAIAAVEAFRSRTPDSLKYLIVDLFEQITLFSNRALSATYKPVDDQYEVTLSTLSEKFVSDTLGFEVAAPLADYIDIAVFATGGSKSQPGKPLVYERIFLTKSENTFVFLVDEKPGLAGIDPYNFLVDRVPDDNLQTVKAMQ
jgi:ABC-2 type transport system permease protein